MLLYSKNILYYGTGTHLFLLFLFIVFIVFIVLIFALVAIILLWF